MMLGLDDIHELTRNGLTNLDVIIIGETIQYKDFLIDDETVSISSAVPGKAGKSAALPRF